MDIEEDTRYGLMAPQTPGFYVNSDKGLGLVWQNKMNTGVKYDWMELEYLPPWFWTKGVGQELNVSSGHGTDNNISINVSKNSWTNLFLNQILPAMWLCVSIHIFVWSYDKKFLTVRIFSPTIMAGIMGTFQTMLNPLDYGALYTRRSRDRPTMSKNKSGMLV